MVYATDGILQTLKAARDATGLSQRDLSARIAVPQSHISKIESGGTDLRLSSLVELARALNHEVVLVPRKLLPAVEAIVRNASSDDARMRASVLNRAQAAVTRVSRLHQNAPNLDRLNQILRELGNFQLGSSELETIRRVTDRLMKLPMKSNAQPVILSASNQLRELRNRIAHAVPEAPRSAYALDEEDDDA